jgi:hypothetical protein
MIPSEDLHKWVIQSPWLDPTKSNLFRDEFRLLAEIKVQPEISEWGPYYTPIPLYQWIFDHDGVDKFFRGLARLAPMFPMVAYKGQVAIWTSPPPSGLGNAIYMVMGHDATGELRLVGGNYFTDPRRGNGRCLESTSFFGHYDDADERTRQDLVRDAIQVALMPDEVELIYGIRAKCEHVHTMAVYIRVLTDEGSLFHDATAIVEGEKPADFSYEFFGEIK